MFLEILAQSFQDHMRAGQFYERLGWVLGGLSFAVLIGGVVFGEMRRKKKQKSDENTSGRSGR